jgi:enamine deaminase RidA (YjgF/YER057c/UK114 family)
MSPEQRLVASGISLPKLGAPIGSYVHARRSGDELYLSGKGPADPDGTVPTGKVGDTVSTEQAQRHARSVGLQLLAAARDHLGSLDRVKGVIKVFGMVNATPNFGEHPKVINGCSDLFVEVFGEAGRHARSAVGIGSLPGQITVEIEAIFAVE